MKNDVKLTAKKRRENIRKLLFESKRAITGQQLAGLNGVSRQVIVTDIALLKAKDLPIIATNRGYLYLHEKNKENLFRRVIICKHTDKEIELELNTLVDFGVSVENVVVEHPLYGELSGSLMIESRYDVQEFINSINRKETSLLSILTDGIHLHTITSDSQEKIDAACERLKELNILYSE